MEPNTTAQTGSENHARQTEKLTEVMARLGEIDQKIEHIIENIHDSLYRLKTQKPEPCDDEPEDYL